MAFTINKPLDQHKRNELYPIARELGVSIHATESKSDLIERIEAKLAEGGVEPVQDPTVLVPARAHDVESAVVAERRAPDRVLRPSELTRLITRSIQNRSPGATQGDLERSVGEVDRFRFIRDEGLPAPRRLYRVSIRKHGRDGVVSTDPVDIDAVDESDARAIAMDRQRVPHKDRHHWLATVVLLEE